jgi:hypothetical protein
VNTYSCCASRIVSVRRPSALPTTKVRPTSAGWTSTSEIVPSASVAVAIGEVHSVKSSVTAPALPRTTRARPSAAFVYSAAGPSMTAGSGGSV